MQLSPKSWLPHSGAAIKSLVFFSVLVSALTIFLSVFNPPVLHMDVCSTTVGFSSLYYKRPNGDYWSKIYPVKSDCQILVFDLLEYRDPVLEWHPPDTTGKYLIRNIWLQAGWSRTEINLDSLSPRRQIETISQMQDGVQIVTTDNAFDPQITFALSRPRRIAFWHWGSSMLQATLITIVVVGLLTMSKKNWGAQIQPAFTLFLQFLKRESFQLGEFTGLSAMSIVLNLYSLSNFSLSIDDEMAAFRITPDIWLEEGRWTTYFLERYIFPQPVIPYAHNLGFALSLALAYMLLVRAHGLHRDWRMYLTFPIFSAFPIWWFITEFYANLPSVSLGLALVSLAGFIFACTRHIWIVEKRISWGWFSLQTVLLTVAIGGYQSFLLMYLAIGVGIVLVDYISNHEISNELNLVISNLVQLGVIAVMGFVAYLALNSFARNVVGVQPSSYIESFWNIKALFTDPLRVFLVSFVAEIRAYYSGAISNYGISLFAIGLVILFFWLMMIVRTYSKGWKKSFFATLLWSSLLALPFLLNIVGAKELPTRSLLAIPYVVWLMSALLLESDRAVVKVINVSLLSILIFQIIITNGTYAATAYVTQQHDRMLAADLYTRLSAVDGGFDRNKTILVDFYGTKHADIIYPNPFGGTMGASFFEFAWKTDDISRMINFMKLLGFSNLQPAEQQERLKLTPIFETMPAWPAPDCVKKVNNIYLIKLSDNPDPLHAQYNQKNK